MMGPTAARDKPRSAGRISLTMEPETRPGLDAENAKIFKRRVSASLCVVQRCRPSAVERTPALFLLDDERAVSKSHRHLACDSSSITSCTLAKAVCRDAGSGGGGTKETRPACASSSLVMLTKCNHGWKAARRDSGSPRRSRRLHGLDELGRGSARIS